MKDSKEDVFHSSAYAKAQSGATLGAASSESYQVRVNINQNRQNIKGYKNSELMMSRNPELKAAAFKPEGGAGAGGIRAAGAMGAAKAPMPPKNPGISFK